MWVFLIPLVVVICWFIFILYKDPRTLMSGFSFVCLLLTILAYIAYFFLYYVDTLNDHFPYITAIILYIGLAVLFLLSIFPILFICLYFIQGIRVIKKEGLRFSNALSLLFSFGLIIYVFIYPFLLNQLQTHPILITISTIITFSVIYLLFVFTMFSFSGLINLIHISKKPIDYIIVLGCGIFGEKMTPLLQGRVDKGIELLNKHPEAKIIFSGGQGEGEDIPEALAMQRYAIQQGVQQDKIIMEDKSMNTEENLVNSYKIINDKKANIVLVTNRYHVLRALMLARKLKIQCKGYGSKTKWYFSLNAHLREFVGYLSITKWKHIIVLSFVTILEVITLLSYFMDKI